MSKWAIIGVGQTGTQGGHLIRFELKNITVGDPSQTNQFKSQLLHHFFLSFFHRFIYLIKTWEILGCFSRAPWLLLGQWRWRMPQRRLEISWWDQKCDPCFMSSALEYGWWELRNFALVGFEGLSFMFGSFSPVEPRKADVVNSCHALQISHQRHSRGIHGGERPWRSHRPGAAARRPSHHGHGDSLNDIKTWIPKIKYLPMTLGFLMHFDVCVTKRSFWNQTFFLGLPCGGLDVLECGPFVWSLVWRHGNPSSLVREDVIDNVTGDVDCAEIHHNCNIMLLWHVAA